MKTTTNDSLVIRSFGHYNTNSGPDFLDAKVEINGFLWVGNIEIHVHASEWNQHGHNGDPHYQNVILHVVFEEDDVIYLDDGSRLPCFTLRNRIPKKALSTYFQLKRKAAWIPCGSLIHLVPDHIFHLSKTALLATRLENRALKNCDDLKLSKGDFSELLYQKLAWSFGLAVNGDAFSTLAKTTPYKILLKHRDNLTQLEALLFGQSGLLPAFSQDPYVLELKREYAFLKTKYSLQPMNLANWRFMRMRPAGFPTLRIAQFSNFIHRIPRIDEIIFNSKIKLIQSYFRAPASNYWTNHYRFEQPSKSSEKRLGMSKVNSIVINVCAPMIFTYGVWKSEESYKQRAIELLYNTQAEDNKVIRNWEALGLSVENAADSQALLELKKTLCDNFGCLSCKIGHHLIRNS